MYNSFDFLLAYTPQNEPIISYLKDCSFLNTLFLVCSEANQEQAESYADDKCKCFVSSNLTNSKLLRQVAQKLSAPYTFIYLSHHTLTLNYHCVERFMQIMGYIQSAKGEISFL